MRIGVCLLERLLPYAPAWRTNDFRAAYLSTSPHYLKSQSPRLAATAEEWIASNTP